MYVLPQPASYVGFGNLTSDPQICKARAIFQALLTLNIFTFFWAGVNSSMGFHTIENYVSRFQLNKRIILFCTVLIHFPLNGNF